ncbi:hypothetical protein C0J52_26884 [Blattella germanica]|nr:hypothetical protein C0J52_26884 [Blattella germanica]
MTKYTDKILTYFFSRKLNSCDQYCIRHFYYICPKQFVFKISIVILLPFCIRFPN